MKLNENNDAHCISDTKNCQILSPFWFNFSKTKINATTTFPANFDRSLEIKIHLTQLYKNTSISQLNKFAFEQSHRNGLFYIPQNEINLPIQ